ncbi:MAG: ACP S-malonyltransferase [Deltaproteobacteria bacterium]|nr:ACP S-malonyltransferase [Deltaproteobacteria bacterium]
MGRVAFIFPGQGSQAIGMGRDFFESYAWARDILTLAERITGKPLSKLCFEGPLEELTLTVNLQPAITAINLICYQALLDRGIKPGYTAGHSLGEFSALCAAGVLSVEDTLRLVNLRGELMHRDATARPGAMQAVIGLSAVDLEAIVELARDRGIVVAANHNTPSQFVITGESAAVAAAAPFAKQKGAKTMALPVSGAWHSPLMEAAAKDFAAHLETTSFTTPTCPVVLNVTGAAETDPGRLRDMMKQQIISPVKWCDVIQTMIQNEVTDFVEVGPKKVLAGLVKKIVPNQASVNIFNVEDMAGVEQLAARSGK